jgi:hypothetical protein
MPRLGYVARRSGWIILTVSAIVMILVASAVLAVAGLFAAFRSRMSSVPH